MVREQGNVKKYLDKYWNKAFDNIGSFFAIFFKSVTKYILIFKLDDTISIFVIFYFLLRNTVNATFLMSSKTG